MATQSSILACKIPWTEEPEGYSPWCHKELNTTERLALSLFPFQAKSLDVLLGFQHPGRHILDEPLGT